MHWQLERGAPVPHWRKPRNCADAKYLAHVWAVRALESRRQTEYYWAEIRRRTLRDFLVRDGNRAWERAVEEVQRAYPGTSSWLLSCSGAEGGHGRWVTYGGGRDYLWAKSNYVVGGWMQFKYPTFVGMFLRAIADVTRRGFLVPTGLNADSGWLSPLGQALAAGWARYTGNDGHHWSASHGRGC